MPAEFVFPEWMMPKDEPTRPVSADSHRVAHAVNRAMTIARRWQPSFEGLWNDVPLAMMP